MQAKNSILSGILFTIIFVTISCNEQQTQNNTNSGSTKNIKEFSSKELYTEMEARNKKIGLWSDENPVAPWNWRKMSKQ